MMLLFCFSIGFAAMAPTAVLGNLRGLRFAILVMVACLLWLSSNHGQQSVVSQGAVLSAPTTLAALAQGALVALPLRCCVALGQSVGEVIEVVRGQSLISWYDPEASTQVSLLGGIAAVYAWCVALSQPGLLQMIVDLGRSSLESKPLWCTSENGVVSTLGQQWTALVWSVSPVILLCLAVPFTIGFATRLAPQVIGFAEYYCIRTLVLGFWVWLWISHSPLHFFNSLVHAPIAFAFEWCER